LIVTDIKFSNWPYSPPKDGKCEHSQVPKTPATTQAIIFGLGSMFNHSHLHQNVGWERDLENLLITYTTLRDIEAGEELCISYGPRLTFKDSDADPESDNDELTELQNMIDLID
jgi:SET domain-containing protein